MCSHSCEGGNCGSPPGVLVCGGLESTGTQPPQCLRQPLQRQHGRLRRPKRLDSIRLRHASDQALMPRQAAAGLQRFVLKQHTIDRAHCVWHNLLGLVRRVWTADVGTASMHRCISSSPFRRQIPIAAAARLFFVTTDMTRMLQCDVHAVDVKNLSQRTSYAVAAGCGLLE